MMGEDGGGAVSTAVWKSLTTSVLGALNTHFPGDVLTTPVMRRLGGAVALWLDSRVVESQLGVSVAMLLNPSDSHGIVL